MRVVFEEETNVRVVVLCDGDIDSDVLDGLAAFIAHQRDRLLREYEILPTAADVCDILSETK